MELLRVDRRLQRDRTGRVAVALGILDAHPDWGYGRDYVWAIWLMLQQDFPGDYVIAMGEAHSVRDLCEIAFGHVGMTWKDHVVLDDKFCRQTEVNALVGEASKARDTLGWKPQTSFQDLVTMMVDAALAGLRR